MTTSTERRDFTHGLDKPFSVTLWGSNPDETDNDDCWTGDDFATREEAIACYREVMMFPDHSQLAKVCGRGGWEYVMIDGPEVHELTQNPDRPSCERRRRELERSDGEWRRERAMEAGMLHGIEAYNDEMGYQPMRFESILEWYSGKSRDKIVSFTIPALIESEQLGYWKKGVARTVRATLNKQ